MAIRTTSISPSSESTARTDLGRRAADRAGDHHHLGTVDLALDDLARASLGSVSTMPTRFTSAPASRPAAASA